MKEQELIMAMEKAETLEEVKALALEAGMEEEDFELLVNKEDDADEEMDEKALEDVNGGIYLTLAVSAAVGYVAYKKIKAFRKKRYQLGYDEEIMSDNRLAGTCENKKK